MPTTDRARDPRHIDGRHIATIVAALAVALAVAAIGASGASAATTCVHQTFTLSPFTYRPCVRDEQILLNDLRYAHVRGPDQLLATDGYYGTRTANDVSSFNYSNPVSRIRTEYVGETTPDTWAVLCSLDRGYGFTGAYWRAAGCSIFVGVGP
jgi:hypothetical protein